MIHPGLSPLFPLVLLRRRGRFGSGATGVIEEIEDVCVGHLIADADGEMFRPLIELLLKDVRHNRDKPE